METFRELRIQSEEESPTPMKALAVSDDVKAVFREAHAADPTEAGTELGRCRV